MPHVRSSPALQIGTSEVSDHKDTVMLFMIMFAASDNLVDELLNLDLFSKLTTFIMLIGNLQIEDID